MRLFADASVHRGVVRALRARGFGVRAGGDEIPTASDLEVLAAATAAHCILLTEDKGFGDLVVRHERSARGVILLRTTPASEAEADAVALSVIAILSQADGNLITIDARGARIRPLSKS